MSVYYNYKDLQRGACSTVIIGKNASTTGKVIMGHNEDDDHSIAQAHIVPRMKHKPGEMVTFETGLAIIPQVEETLGYLWTDVKCPGGISFADTFVNECGVAIATNACRESRDATGAEHDNWKDYNVGYALRRLIAERAHTAREGVKVAAELVEKYGYTSSRSYQIADKEEAWVLQVPRGYRCVAKRVPDDHVYYIPNHYRPTWCLWPWTRRTTPCPCHPSSPKTTRKSWSTPPPWPGGRSGCKGDTGGNGYDRRKKRRSSAR